MTCMQNMLVMQYVAWFHVAQLGKYLQAKAEGQTNGKH